MVRGIVARIAHVPRGAEVAFALGLVVGAVVNVAVDAVPRHEAVVASDDFSYIWAGPRTILDGADPYDPAQWTASVARLGTERYEDPAVYSYPPYVALLLLPLGALPLAVADAIWLWGGLAAACAGLLALLRTYGIASPPLAFVGALVLTLSHASAFALNTGQWSFLLVAALALIAVGIARRRALPAFGGAVVLLAKPQLALIALGGLALQSWRRHDRATAAAIGAAAIAALLAVAAVLPHAWPAWIELVAFVRSNEPNVAALPGLLRPLAFGVPLAVAISALAVLVAWRADPRQPGSTALWMTASLVAAPYARSYDHLLLIVPLLIAGTRADIRTSNALAAATAFLLLILPWVLFVVVSPALGSESITALVPLAAFGVVALRAWPAAETVGPAG